MAPEAAVPAKREFTCTLCGTLKPFFYDWQRCYDCMLAAVTRDYQTTPTICAACCRTKHHYKFSMK